MKSIKWGIAGPGIIANKFAKAIQQVEGVVLTSVASRSLERGKAFADQYDIEHVFDSYEAMAASDKVDVVYVSTAHPFHKDCAEIFIKAGKHVLCEKPVCVNAEQAIQLKKCSEKHGVFLMEAMWTRFLPAIKEACNIVKSGTIGEVRCVEADFCYASTPLEEAKLFQKHMAGGSLLDVGVYGLHFASLFLEEEPERISAVADVKDGVDLHTCIMAQYPNGGVSRISSAISLYKPEAAYIYGTKGYLYLPQFYGAQEIFVHVEEEVIQIRKPSIGDGFEEEIYEVCNCIREGITQSKDLPMDESIRILKQMDAVRNKIGVKYPFEKE